MFAHVVRFSRFLHDAGVDVNSSNLMDLCRSFSFMDISNRIDFYEAAKCTLVSNRESLDIFNLAFHQYWDQFQPPFPENKKPGDETDDDQNDDSEEPEKNKPMRPLICRIRTPMINPPPNPIRSRLAFPTRSYC